MGLWLWERKRNEVRFLKRFKNKEGKITCLSVISVVLLNAVPLFYAFTCILPVAWLFYSTFKTMTEFSANVLALPKSWTNFVNYEYVLTRMNLLGAMFNTVRISVIVVTCVVLFAFINGYFLARFQFFGKRFLAGLYMPFGRPQNAIRSSNRENAGNRGTCRSWPECRCIRAAGGNRI